LLKNVKNRTKMQESRTKMQKSGRGFDIHIWLDLRLFIEKTPTLFS
jgi:hypothetical protein